MSSLNDSHGTTISELELTLIAVKKLLTQKIEASPKAGFIVAKGKPNEARLRYREMLQVIDSLEAKLSLEGCMSFGVCKTCGRFNPKVSSRKCFGACGTTNKIMHEYDSCDAHTKQGGGFGL